MTSEKGATGVIQDTLDSKQITFDLDKLSVLYWRRVLLIRYFVQLGKSDSVNIEWSDFDKKSTILTLHDEEYPFNDKLPQATLAKTIVQIKHLDQKLITITLHYTTNRCLVQGNCCRKWVQEEFEKIKSVVDSCLKGDKPKISIDKKIRTMQVPKLPGVTESDQLQSDDSVLEFDENEQTKLKSLMLDKTDSDSEDKDVPVSPQIMPEETKKITYAKSEKKQSIPTEFVDSQLIETIRKLENKLVEIHSDYSLRIEQLTDTVVTLTKTVNEMKLQIKPDTQNATNGQEQSQKVESFFENNEQNMKSVTSKIDKIDSKLNMMSKKEDQSNMEKTVEKFLDINHVNESIMKSVSSKIDLIDKKLDLMQKTVTTERELTDNQEQTLFLGRQPKESENLSHLDTETKRNSSVKDSEIKNHQYDMWLIGSSIVKDLDPKLIYKFKKSRVTTLRDKTVRGAREFLNLRQVSAQVVVYQIGSNDLEDCSPEEVITCLEQLIKDTKCYIPECEIIINELLPRYLVNETSRRIYEAKRLETNQLLHELGKQYNVKIIRQQNLSQIHFGDGIHLNQSGLAQYVRNIKIVVNPILGVKGASDQNQPRRPMRQRPEYNRYNNNPRNDAMFHYGRDNKNTAMYNYGRNNRNHTMFNYDRNDNSRYGNHGNQDFNNFPVNDERMLENSRNEREYGSGRQSQMKRDSRHKDIDIKLLRIALGLDV